ncbi:hypothetical protein K469DRAFT_753180 [Zopfia rhizophila CBS 207.26]|uniref:Glycoside hydrolase family 43 protein n=1 Tax=Zopfia rhizophila CBS 207.26 TaxID=1314779 RepID=A0A6A6DMX2_9PEZI|nr:hypothetical protein K469DRAFT_753180 [Zopfia rhizophila CBS 207.26]
MALLRLGLILFCLPTLIYAQDDTLGIKNGYTAFSTANFDIKLVKDSQTLASLKPSGGSFDFSPYDYLSRRARDGQYHLGDLTFRYRTSSTANWINGDTAAKRAPVSTVTDQSALTASILMPTLQTNTRDLNITRKWTNLNGDLGLTFTLTNQATGSLEIGSLGFPIEFNSIFTDRTAEQGQAVCSLHDPYIGLDAGFVRVVPISGNGPALVVTPIGSTPFEGWRNLAEVGYQGTYYGSQTFEGFYEWQTLTKAYAEIEWKNVQPWNPATSKTLKPGESLTVGLRFSLAKEGASGIENAIKKTGTPVAVGVPGYVVPRDLTARLYLFPNSTVTGITASPAALTVTEEKTNVYTIKASSNAWGRVRLTISYQDGKSQTVHYYVTKPASDVLDDAGNFALTKQWYTNTSDPFGRAPSVLSWDRETNNFVEQDSRVWIAGLSDEGGAGSFLVATMKQFARPNAKQVNLLESFINNTMFGDIQNADYSVRKSVFYYQPSAVPGYRYDSRIDWTSWTSWNKASAYDTSRAYDYIHLIAAYWSIYRVGRSYPSLLTTHTWDWYLTQASKTAARLFQRDSRGNPITGYALVGLMEETVLGELLKDLYRENLQTEAARLESDMSQRAKLWDSQAVPFGSEMAWDSTGQEGVYYWTKYFNLTRTQSKTIGTIFGLMPTVPHWGWNGNARRYWDNIYGGKLRRIERQIHHYGSALNSLPLLSEFRSSSSKSTYMLRLGHGGSTAPLTNIDQEGFGSASFHSWPDTLKWDAYSGDYGPGFVGMMLGNGAYLTEDKELGGTLAFGADIVSGGQGSSVSFVPKDAVKRRVYIGRGNLFVEIDAGYISRVDWDAGSRQAVLTISQLPGLKAESVIVWVEGNYKVVSPTGATNARGGSKATMGADGASVTVGPT